MEIWIATSNSGKLSEYKNLFKPHGIEVKSPLDLNVFTFPPENGDTFEANARIKAKSLKAVKNDVWVVGEDSGLEVEGLGGLPGIHSARYAGEKAQSSENVAKLLKMVQIRTPGKRDARFYCSLVVFDPEGNEHIFDGELKGKISMKQQGTSGFGYDPVFIPEGFEQTLAELQPGEKNKISHRSMAFKRLLDKMKG